MTSCSDVTISFLLWDIVRVLSGVANLASDYICLNLCSFRDLTFFRVFSKFFRKIGYRKFHKISYSHRCGEALSRYSQDMRFLPPNMTAQILVTFEIF